MFKTKTRRAVLKSKDEIELMRRAGNIVAKILNKIREYARPGISTGELNDIAEDLLKANDTTPVFKGYPNPHQSGVPFPASITTCVNAELVHGIPSYSNKLQDGDILSVDCGAYYQGWVGDAAVTVPVGQISQKAQQLLQVTEQALYEGISYARLGNKTEDISASIQHFVESRGYSVVREYTGHGVGRSMHEDPQVPNYGQPGKGTRLRRGMTIALEPMVNVGTWKTKLLNDNWTVVTADGTLSAHFEHSIAITDSDADILTQL